MAKLGPALIDERALLSELAALKEPKARRTLLLARLKAALATSQGALARRLKSGASGAAIVRARSRTIDQLVRLILEVAVHHFYRRANPTEADRLCVVALGGYGRSELLPFSDIDLLVLYPYKRTAWCEQVAEFLLYALWDLGLRVGQAVRSVDDCLRRAKDDFTIRTTLLEARFVWGERALFETLMRRFEAEIVPGSAAEFIAAKLEERDARHRRLGDSRYVLEPNVKDGKGALRDLHTLFWIAKYIYRVKRFGELVPRGIITQAEYRTFVAAEDFLWRVRAHLHLLAGRAEERLTFDVQAEIARRLGVRGASSSECAMRFMKRYFRVVKTVGDLTRVLCAQLEAEHLRAAPRSGRPAALARADAKAFTIRDGRLSVKRRDAFGVDPARVLRLFRLAQILGCDIHPRALRLLMETMSSLAPALRRAPEAAREFLDILTDATDLETTLRRLNEAGVLARFLPDFGRIVGQAQHDMYHVYTVDEHTVRALGVLAGIERGELKDELPLASAIIRKVVSKRALHLAVLLHDVAKGAGGGHSEKGARIAESVARRLGLTAEEVETVGWLVRHHLALSNTAFKRDVNDPKTIADLAALVQSVERLRLLLVFTAADIRAVGPGRWNAWRGALLRTLYARAEEAITGGHETLDKDQRVAQAKAALKERLSRWSEPARAAHLARLPDHYWLAFDPKTHARHAEFLAQAQATGPALALEVRVEPERAITEIAVCTKDRAGLFAMIAGAMALNGANVVDAKIFTTEDGFALDVFFVQDARGGAFAEPARLAKLERDLAVILEGRLDLEAAIAARRARAPSPRAMAFRIQPRVLIDNGASRRHTRIEVNGRDRPGLLYDLTHALSGLGLSIASAQIATYGARVVDAFYVSGAGGRRVRAPERLEAIRAALLPLLREGEASEAPERAAPSLPRAREIH